MHDLHPGHHAEQRERGICCDYTLQVAVHVLGYVLCAWLVCGERSDLHVQSAGDIERVFWSCGSADVYVWEEVEGCD